ncbi:anti-sigma-F factor Fin [Paenibacillus gansuensis]|uniref:Anti-sigma-F factor Fin n=1 Tax=Paenibacillus gansuensis TaxID=306542 RepID=A0ABW5PBL3_9BACL
MAVKYVCRHCQTPLGTIQGSEVSEFRLGFHFLTPEERSDIIAYTSEGDVQVNVTCDYCKEALEHNPELSLVSNPLQ